MYGPEAGDTGFDWRTRRENIDAVCRQDDFFIRREF